LEIFTVYHGKVKWWNQIRGFGFITPDAGGPDVFCHFSAVEGVASLVEGDKVEYSEAPGRDGKSQAANVRLLAGQALAEAEPVQFWAK
jgi:CspA family cold shock protein